MADRNPLNIIIPIGGVGSRFAKHGYRYPKPLINIVGRPMLLWLLDCLTLEPDDAVWIAVSQEVDEEFLIGQLVAKHLNHVQHNVLRLQHPTKGASETLYIVCQSMTQTHLDRKTVSLDCDTIYWNDILGHVRSMPRGHGGCFYFPDNGDKPIFSYIKTDVINGLESIVDIQEKKAISNKANSGAYVFRSARELKSYAAEVLDVRSTNAQDVGEYFTSQLISHMIHSGVPYVGLPIQKQDMSCVGTPQQLQDFLRHVKSDGCKHSLALKKRRFCFDLDMTLVGFPTVPGDYSTCPPIEKNIRLVKQLYNAGHYIIIHTARRMRTHGGNVGAVIADIGPITFAQLTSYGIPFHEVYFGKPYADAYVDDLAVNANLDTAREIGWLDDSDPVPDGPAGDAGREPELLIKQQNTCKKAGMIAARDFNTIQVVDGKVIKSSKSEQILGEIYFYSHMPAEIAGSFPVVHGIDFIAETGTFTITMDNCRGRTFSHLLVGRSITKGRLLRFLKGLHDIHTAKQTNNRSLEMPPLLEAQMARFSKRPSNQSVNIYSNYGEKFRRRYEQHRVYYDSLGPLAESLFNRIHEFLDTYEAEGKGVSADIIHGDPVFSNAILSPDETKVTFIDVRGQVGDVLTTEGDIHYDLAKVLQSLCGYDHILFQSENGCDLAGFVAGDKPLLDEADDNLLSELREYFFDFLRDTYSMYLHRKTLLRITASLIFSLIPLHRPELGAVFLKLCEDTLERANHMKGGQTNGSK
ncbi:phosphatase iiic [Purpureocillium lavendulum]|uniref:Mannose-1-phosphate guanyltransferase n=1 Tax=Purpureocillium lavendulum TaxID=1247861 RepID=A0AB34FL03_9HYPO|nr:phosphatase iiic [Purpureocillium lavendulum]